MWWSMWSGFKLYLAHGIRRDALGCFGSASRALGCHGGLYEGRGDPCVKVGDGGDDEALRLLRLRLVEGAIF